MAEDFDPYVEWLGLRASNRPLNYYQLFALDDFEDDPQRIGAAADAALARARSVRPGGERKRWQQLLDELLLAKLCLIDPSRKLQLDRQLRTPGGPPTAPGPPSAGVGQVVVEPPRINPDLFPPGMAGPPPVSTASANAPPVVAAPGFAGPPPGSANPPPPSAGLPPTTAAVMPPFQRLLRLIFNAAGQSANAAAGSGLSNVNPAMPPVSGQPNPAFPPVSSAMPPVSAPPSPAFPPTSPVVVQPPSPAFPPVTAQLPIAIAPTTAPSPASGWSGWPKPSCMPAPSAPPTGALPLMGAPASVPTGSAASATRFPAPATTPRPVAAVPSNAVPSNSMPQACSTASPMPVPVAQPVPAQPVERQPSSSFASAQPTPVSRAVNAPIAVGPRFEPGSSISSTRPTQSRNLVNLAIGAGVLAVIAMAVMILKPPSDDGDSKPPATVAAKPSKASSESKTISPARPKPADDPQSDDTFAGEDETPIPAKPEPKSPRPRPNPRYVPKPPADPSKTQVAQAPAGDSGSPAAPAANPEKTKALRQALAEVRGALAAREVEQAKKKLGSAKQFAQSADDHNDIARMDSLAGYVRGFWDGVRESLKGLQTADEVRFNNMTAAVVDSDANGITLHTPGKNHEFTLKNMPATLAMTLAQRWFDQSAANKLFMGAFLAVDPQGDKGEARRLWESATSGGASADDLMPLLSGATAEFVAPVSDTAPPSEKQIAMALKQVKVAYQADYKAAKTPELKVELGRKLLDVAAGIDNPAERFALLREALDLAATAGSAPLIADAVDHLSSAFNVDSLEVKADGLAKAASVTSNAQAAKEIARSALALLDVAVQENRTKPAGKLSQAATNAARKSKDAELIKAATAGSQKVQELGK